tara:strand:+ start:59878 stop:60345 length:468 start_codon:yes stop_codon:yes gene_type:complete
MSVKPEINAKRIFSSLSGDWGLRRTMGEMGTFAGTARFYTAPDSPENSLRYREEGVLQRIDGHHFDGYREYDFVLRGQAIEMLFRDPVSFGNRYVLLDFNKTSDNDILAAQDDHPCGNDMYHHRMLWHHADHFETRIKVVGPNKDYELHTLYHRP